MTAAVDPTHSLAEAEIRAETASAIASPPPAPADITADAMVQPEADAATGGSCAPVVILDSNVWVDLLVFDDPVARPIGAALDAGHLDAAIDHPCLHELARVLDYPQFAPYTVDKTAALARTAGWTRCVGEDSRDAHPVETLPSPFAPALPRCSDRDDQKFLVLAAVTKARWLVTKDKALLKLNRRMTRDFGCQIVLPAVFVAACLTASPATTSTAT